MIPAAQTAIPTPHPARGEALVRSWRERHSSARRLAALIGLGLSTGLVAALAPGFGAPLLGATWTVVLCPWAELLAVCTGAVDWPDRRVSLGRPANRLGALAWFGGILGASWALPPSWLPVSFLACGGGALLLVGTIHEISAVSRVLRLAAVVGLAAFAAQALPRPGGILPPEVVPSPWGAVLSAAWIAAVAWSFHSLGATEGLVPVLSGVLGILVGCAAFTAGDTPSGWLALTIAAASLAFAAVQEGTARPVGILLGRTGAVLAGLMLATLACGVGGTVPGSPSSVPGVVVVFALPVIVAAWSEAKNVRGGDLPAALAAVLGSRRRSVALLVVLSAWAGVGDLAVRIDGAAGAARSLGPLGGALAVLLVLVGAAAPDARGDRRGRAG